MAPDCQMTLWAGMLAGHPNWASSHLDLPGTHSHVISQADLGLSIVSVARGIYIASNHHPENILSSWALSPFRSCVTECLRGLLLQKPFVSNRGNAMCLFCEEPLL